jgi:hypothetical protein
MRLTKHNSVGMGREMQLFSQESVIRKVSRCELVDYIWCLELANWKSVVTGLHDVRLSIPLCQ